MKSGFIVGTIFFCYHPGKTKDSICYEENGKRNFEVTWYRWEYTWEKKGDPETYINEYHTIPENDHEFCEPSPAHQFNLFNSPHYHSCHFHIK